MANNIARGWLVLFAIIIFVGGIAVGVLMQRQNTRPGGPRMGFRGSQRMPRVQLQPGLHGPHGVFRGPAVGDHAKRPFLRLANALELTAGQREQLEALFDEERSRIGSLTEDARSRFRSAQKERRVKIIEVLTPEQRERFDKFTPWPQKPRRDFRRGRERRGPSRGF
jgi:Spy/CpxP family protein refolding chaperone